MNLKRALAALLFLCLALAAVARAQGEDDGEEGLRMRGRVRAPELEGGRGWLNTAAPLSLAALRGKVVLLDFWTYGCINCIHVIPDLKRLEAKYARQLVVIGVHSAKFDNERETENIRRIVMRYGVEHPVINDADFRVWRAYAVRAWPTLVLIDPSGYVHGVVAGEGHYETLDREIGRLVEEARRAGTLNEEPLKLALERAKTADLPLAFPGKILADERGSRLFVADTNHNRIVVARLDGTLIEVVGTGEAGARDGGFGQATFRQPQGLALDGDSLYVADTGNHTIRRVDLKARAVETIAGTGEQSRQYGPRAGGRARSTALSSPWDLHLTGRALYIAMAGPHQIWKLDLDKGELSVFAGTGHESRTDGARTESAFAQPSGLVSDGRTLYVADSESNIIRAVSLGAAGAGEDEVRTLAGGDLFEFGDRDGLGDDVRLQHPLGLALHEGRLYVADTYNHKIKVLDPRAQTVKTFAGSGRPGQADGARPTFYEPGGISVARGRLYVADTNNHAVRVVDLTTGATTTLVMRGLQPPALSSAANADANDAAEGPNAEEIKVASQKLGSRGDASLVVSVALPEGHHINTSAPNRYKVTVEGDAQRLALVAEGVTKSSLTGASKDLRLPLRLPLRALSEGTTLLRVQLTLYYCREDNTGTCRVKTLAFRAPVEVTDAEGSPREIVLKGKVE